MFHFRKILKLSKKDDTLSINCAVITKHVYGIKGAFIVGIPFKYQDKYNDDEDHVKKKNDKFED